MSYHLEYVDKPERFDEVVEQDGVKVVLDSKALFSIIGSEMDWQEDALGAKFVFNSEDSACFVLDSPTDREGEREIRRDRKGPSADFSFVGFVDPNIKDACGCGE